MSVNVQLQSNCIRDEYMKEIMGRTMNEIHDDIATVFGPFATDAFITKDKQPYYTRDGKELLESIHFDNELSNYILKIIYQAVAHQGNDIGDGTTTLAVFYTNLYNEIIKSEFFKDKTISTIRPVWNNVINRINDELKKLSHPMTDDDFKSAIFTCTQDADLSSKIYQKLHDKIEEEAYIVINKSNINTDFNVMVHNDPKIKATKQYTLKPFTGDMKKCAMFHCNGMLDISHVEVILRMIERRICFNVPGVDGNPTKNELDLNLVIFCNGITESTRRVLKELNNLLHEQNINPEGLNNFTIFTIDEYRTMSADQIEDLSTIITDEYGIGGLVNSLVYEANLYQAFCAESTDGDEFSTLKTFDTDAHILNKLREMFTTLSDLTYDEVEGIRIHKELGPVAKKRYDELHKEIEEEKSQPRKVSLNKRLRSIYGQFVEVEVGSKLIKDSQRKYELILDAVRSSLEAVKHGVLNCNSILATLNILGSMIYPEDETTMALTETEQSIVVTIANAMYHTFSDMLLNATIGIKDTYPEFNDFYYHILSDAIIEKFDLTRVNTIQNATIKDILCVCPPEHAMFRLYDPLSWSKENITIPASEDYESFTVEKCIVEPVSVMTNILENSTTPLELALAKTFHMNSFVQNYI